MRDQTIMQEFARVDGNVQMIATREVGCEARIRVWEDMALKRGGMLWLIVRNIFSPAGLHLEVLSRFKKLSDFTPEKPKDNIEVVTVKSDEELQAELAKGEKCS